MQEEEVSLDALSAITCRFALQHYRENEDRHHCDVLIAAFDGHYHDGSTSDDDAHYTTAIL